MYKVMHQCFKDMSSTEVWDVPIYGYLPDTALRVFVHIVRQSTGEVLQILESYLQEGR